MWFELEIERPEILGSGSDIQSVGTVKTLEEALDAMKNHRCNRITKFERVDGRLVRSVYDDFTGKFE